MIKPEKLNIGDTVATISPSWGCAGDDKIKWKYNLGVQRLKELGLNVVAAPNSLKGSTFLRNCPEARAEDFMWAFENKEVKAIIANIGGNDSVKLMPFLSPSAIHQNPKILCGYSDFMTLHLYCYQHGLSSFYGDNLLTTIAETQGWHTYSRKWFQKVFFDNSVIGDIPPSEDWSFEFDDHRDPKARKDYIKNEGYVRIQGKGKVRGRLFGGHGGLMEFTKEDGIILHKSDFLNKILFFEDIPEVCNVEYMGDFFQWLGKNEYLQVLNGIVIGKIRSGDDFNPYAKKIRSIVTCEYGLEDLPILYGVNFGHTSPICIFPYDAMAELDVESLRFSILESGVI